MKIRSNYNGTVKEEVCYQNMNGVTTIRTSNGDIKKAGNQRTTRSVGMCINYSVGSYQDDPLKSETTYITKVCVADIQDFKAMVNTSYSGHENGKLGKVI